MKTIKLSLIFLISLFSIGFVACDDDTKEVENEVSYDTLPDDAKNFLKSYFYGYEVLLVDEEHVKDLVLYEVNLEGGYTVEFNGDGEWLQVQAPENTAIPNIGFIPEVIRQALNYQYSGYGVQQVNTTGNGYKIKLVTGLNLEANMSGEITALDNIY